MTRSDRSLAEKAECLETHVETAESTGPDAPEPFVVESRRVAPEQAGEEAEQLRAFQHFRDEQKRYSSRSESKAKARGPRTRLAGTVPSSSSGHAVNAGIGLPGPRPGGASCVPSSFSGSCRTSNGELPVVYFPLSQ